MKYLSFFILVILIITSCKKEESHPNAPTYFTFSGRIGGYDNSTIVSFDSNIVICGNTNNSPCVLKITKGGNQIWRQDNLGNNCSVSAIVEAHDMNLYICGSTGKNYYNSMNDVLLIKTNSNGDTIWTKTYGSTKDDYGVQIINTSDGNLLICGLTYGDTTTGYCDICLIKVNLDGDTIWTQTYKDIEQEEPFHLMQTINGEFLVTGTNEDDTYNGRVLYLLKVSQDGTKLWDKKIGPSWRWGFCSIELSNGDILTCGKKYDPFVSPQLMLIKTNSTGNFIWEKEIGGADQPESGYSMKLNANGTITITGSSNDFNAMSNDIILLNIDNNGNQIWLKKFGGTETEWGINLIKDTNDDNIITGTTFSFGPNAANGNIFMIKTDCNGNFK